MADDQNNELEKKKLIYDYAWHWFSYHASQRMTVFRFFFLAATILAVGYYQTANHEYYWLSVGFAALLFITTCLFWRLDSRTAELIKIGENLLLVFETKFGTVDGMQISLIAQANSKNTEHTTRFFPRILYSYTQVTRALFLIFIAASILCGAYSINRVTSPTTAIGPKVEKSIQPPPIK